MDNTAGVVLLKPEHEMVTAGKLLQLVGLMIIFVGLLIYVSTRNLEKCDFDVEYDRGRHQRHHHQRHQHHTLNT